MLKLLIGIILFTIGQALIWFQTNGQFINTWAKENPFWMAVIFSFPISYMFIYATTYVVEFFGGSLWPGRFIGFGTGMIAFSILTYIFMGEGITTKTLISLILATTLVALQIFWK
tara:strand:- start:162 stop:506 length:345 start_codon:yes stop_codon:yes gene_type:complete